MRERDHKNKQKMADEKGKNELNIADIVLILSHHGFFINAAIRHWTAAIIADFDFLSS